MILVGSEVVKRHSEGHSGTSISRESYSAPATRSENLGSFGKPRRMGVVF